MKKIVAVLCPMPIEFESVERELGILGEYTDHENLEEKIFHLPSYDLILARCGIGKTMAAAKAQKIIMTYEPQHIFVCGVAGAIADNLKVFDVLVASKVIHGDFNFGPYKNVALVDSTVPFFQGKPGFSSTGYIMDRLDSDKLTGIIATLDQFADEEIKVMLEQKCGAIAIDMESAPIAQIATMYDIPVTVIRSFSDSRTDTEHDFEKNCPKACECAAKELIHLLNKLA
ncbi:MAG: 5'-methylthioadenosine/S-adenosylhomocysteine nucleosidase [Alphaproteobacteria bacterium]|nr:5'-methylthioadenosine/S-adenosylhomocysteine nucleosidase [Alphaproteobacteria bacterium]